MATTPVPRNGNGKHPGGRPTKLTPEVQTTIVNALAAGTYLETAAKAAGINQDTLHSWLVNGARCKSGIQKEFSEAIKKALASAEIRFGATIALASQYQWQAAAWMLERRYPDRWGRIDRHEVTGEGGGAIEIRVRFDPPPGIVVEGETRELENVTDSSDGGGELK